MEQRRQATAGQVGEGVARKDHHLARLQRKIWVNAGHDPSNNGIFAWTVSGPHGVAVKDGPAQQRQSGGEWVSRRLSPTGAGSHAAKGGNGSTADTSSRNTRPSAPEAGTLSAESGSVCSSTMANASSTSVMG